MIKRVILLTTFTFWVSIASASDNQITGIASVIDGDTIEIHGQRIRIFGADAPETSQVCRRANGREWRCGQQAALQLADYLAGRPVSCTINRRDRYQRLLATCVVGGRDVAAWLIKNGWAVRYYDKFRVYEPDQNHAKQSNLGIWAGQFDWPKTWRQQRN